MRDTECALLARSRKYAQRHSGIAPGRNRNPGGRVGSRVTPVSLTSDNDGGTHLGRITTFFLVGRDIQRTTQHPLEPA